MKKWTDEELLLLKNNYPDKGKMWCANALGRGEASVRWMAAELGLKANTESEFFKDWQARAAQSKVGKKRPDQALVIKKLHEDGKLKKTEAQKAAISEKAKKRLKENPHPRGMLGKKHSAETKARFSDISKKRFAEMSEDKKFEKLKKMLETKAKNGTLVNPRIKTTWKGGWRTIGTEEKFYRSRWEANYARFLEWQKNNSAITDWKHEPRTFWFEGIKRGCVSYLPDFWVLKPDGSEEYHEVKGWMDDRSKTKLKRMKKYHPLVTLVLVDSKKYKQITGEFSHLIEGWE